MEPDRLLTTPPAGWSLTCEVDYDLAGPEYDRAAPAELSLRSYVLCSSPRSGSTMLSEALAFSDRAGVPIEYFDPTNAMRVIRQRWGCRSLGAYIDELHRRRCSANGVFGLKIHWFQLASVSRARSGDAAAGRLPALAETLDRLAPAATIVRVVRGDRRRQALSWARAERTGRWSARSADHESPPPVPPEEVDDYERRLAAEEAGWDRLLDHLGRASMVVRYEDMCEDFAGTVRAVGDYIGCPLGDDVPAPRTVRQSG